MIKLICKHCSKEFELWPSKIKLGQGKFCSRHCKHESWRKRLTLHRFMAKFTVSDNGCWQWKDGKTERYPSFTYNQTNHHAHRVSYMLFKGDIPEGLCVCHSCDNPKCVNPRHLFLGTMGDNLRDMFRKGRRNICGENHTNNKLTTEQVLSIRKMAKDNKPTKEIAKEFNISTTNVNLIIRGAGWRHLPV